MLNQNISESLECPICLDIYDTDVRKPMLLECSHNLCKPCLNSIISSSADGKTVECPQCREPSQIEKWKNKPNRIVIEIIEKTNSSVKSIKSDSNAHVLEEEKVSEFNLHTTKRKQLEPVKFNRAIPQNNKENMIP